MITRLEVKNYRHFSNLGLSLDRTTLLMGNNGCGKTSIFDILWGIRQLLAEGASCADAFPLKTLPRWLAQQKGNVQQSFALTLESPFGPLHYRLAIDQNPSEGQSRIASETLSDDTGPLFSFVLSTVQLHRDDHSEGPTFKLDWNRSGLASVPPSDDNQKLTHFKARIRRIACLRLDAPRMEPRSEKESLDPERDFANFASWYRSALQRNTGAVADFVQELREVIPGFSSLNLQALGQGYSILQARMAGAPEDGSATKGRGKEYSLDFDELSDGQRALIALYAILHFHVERGAILCLDEPDSFLSARSLTASWIRSSIGMPR
jgi:hypothetical protein